MLRCTSHFSSKSLVNIFLTPVLRLMTMFENKPGVQGCCCRRVVIALFA